MGTGLQTSLSPGRCAPTPYLMHRCPALQTCLGRRTPPLMPWRHVERVVKHVTQKCRASALSDTRRKLRSSCSRDCGGVFFRLAFKSNTKRLEPTGESNCLESLFASTMAVLASPVSLNSVSLLLLLLLSVSLPLVLHLKVLLWDSSARVLASSAARLPRSAWPTSSGGSLVLPAGKPCFPSWSTSPSASLVSRDVRSPSSCCCGFLLLCTPHRSTTLKVSEGKF